MQTSAMSTRNTLGAVGIVVDDIDRSVSFYSQALGMVQTQKYDFPHLKEVVLAFENGRGSSIVLMHYPDGRERPALAGKLVFYVEDPVAIAAAIKEHGGTVTQEPVPLAVVGGAIVGFAADPDGYAIELLQVGRRRDTEGRG